jgi:membrane-bound serine protease (ClpP class)
LYQNSRNILVVLGLILSLVLSTNTVKAIDPPKKVMVLTIHAEIDPRMSRYIEYGLTEAQNQKSDYILIDMNTFGGALDDADKIRTLLLNSKTPVWVFINKNAASAGALISIACDKIYMEEGSNIGSATVVNGEGEPAPEKYQAYMRSLMRSTAEASGRDPLIAEGMVGKPLSQDSATIGHVISYTTEEAIANKYCEGKVSAIEEILTLNNISSYSLQTYEHGSIDKFIAFFMNPYLRSLLVLLIIGGIYFELQTPGIGFPLAAAAVGAVLYFVPSYMNGLSEYWEIALFALGILLIIVEFFVIPGFGFIGITGIILAFASLILVSVNNHVFDFTFVPAKDLEQIILLTGISSCLVMVLAITLGRKIIESAYFKKVSLQEQFLSTEGFTVNQLDKALTQKTGTAQTDLRPSGKVLIEGKAYNAYTSGEYIEKDQAVIVIEQNMGSLKVKKQA